MKAIAVAARLHHLVLSAQCCSMLQAVAAAVACPETGNVGHAAARRGSCRNCRSHEPEAAGRVELHVHQADRATPLANDIISGAGV
jgi:hypothetical protein